MGAIFPQITRMDSPSFRRHNCRQGKTLPASGNDWSEVENRIDPENTQGEADGDLAAQLAAAALRARRFPGD